MRKKEAGKGKSTSPGPNSLVALDAVFWSSWSPGTPQRES